MKKVNFKEVKTTHPLGCWPCMCHLRGTKQCICLCTDRDRLRRQVWKIYTEETDGWRWEGGVVAVCKGLSIVSIMDNQLLLQERNPLSFCTLIFKIRIKSTPSPWMENADPGAASKAGWVTWSSPQAVTELGAWSYNQLWDEENGLSTNSRWMVLEPWGQQLTWALPLINRGPWCLRVLCYKTAIFHTPYTTQEFSGNNSLGIYSRVAPQF